ncbi:inositol monophosphatase family protein [Nocardia sp. BMG111209]|uniref:inositol monophosphatase family protein n=1 Tax=Nocardia sp. BMG111209 TaxID=1160137 RepID=UPI0003763CF6|nr:inositol monophosphatase family protein [Nocardia sp. BMG111209]
MTDTEALWDMLDDRLLPLFRQYRRNLSDLRVDTKADDTLLSEADIAVQTAIIDTISHLFPGSEFVAEEDDWTAPTSGDPTWIVDPIDGTAEFVVPGRREFCSVVCRVDRGIPSAAYVLAPELGTGGTPISIHWAEGVTVDGQPAPPLPAADRPGRASVTRSADVPARRFESELADIGCRMKVRTTSQTLDMVRTCIDLTAWTGESQERFDLFYRTDQKIWDGAAGIGLSLAMGRSATDGRGAALVPLSEEFLNLREPVLAETVSGAEGCVRWFTELLAESRSI